jgi:nucleotide-binding universal stress UspA family protein
MSPEGRPREENGCTQEEVEMSEFPAKILLATDGSEDATLAAQAAVGLAKDTGAELHVVHVGEVHHVYPPRTPAPLPPAETEAQVRKEHQTFLDHEVERIEQSGGTVAESYLRIGKPAEEILRCSEDIVAGMIVVGNQGFGQKFSRLRRFVMGSTSEKVARYARCSVLVVRRDLYDRPSA